MARKNFSRRVLVNIKRDMTEITPKVVWQHEIPILELIHGEGNITTVDATTLDDGYSDKTKPELLPWNKTMEVPAKPSTSMGLGFIFIGSADLEWQRLADVYNRDKDENVLLVEKVYGRSQDGRLAELLGEPKLDDLPEAQLRERVLAYGYAPEPHKDSSNEEKKASWEARVALRTMPKPELVKLAESVGVDVG